MATDTNFNDYLTHVISDDVFHDVLSWLPFWNWEQSLSLQALRIIVSIVMESTKEEISSPVESFFKCHVSRFPPFKHREFYYSLLYDEIPDVCSKKGIYCLLTVLNRLIEMSKSRHILQDKGEKKKTWNTRKSSKFGNASPFSIPPSQDLYEYIQENYIGNPHISELPEFNAQSGSSAMEETHVRTPQEGLLSCLSMYTTILEDIYYAIVNESISKEDGSRFFAPIIPDIIFPSGHYLTLCNILCLSPLKKPSTLHLSNFIGVIHKVFLMYGTSSQNISNCLTFLIKGYRMKI